MKKNFIAILLIILVVSIASVAWAADPFSVVPKNDWSYSAVNQLITAGIISGDKFDGDKTITRYEMAGLVAQAIPKQEKATNEQKSLIYKLSTEYNTELLNWAFVVRQIPPETKADKLNFIGSYLGTRYDYDKNNGVKVFAANLDLIMTYRVNKDLTITTENEFNRKYNGDNGQTSHGAGYDFNILGETAYATLNGNPYTVNLGRFKYTPTYGLVFDGKAQGLQITHGQPGELQSTLTFGSWVNPIPGDVGNGYVTSWGPNKSGAYQAIDVIYPVNSHTNFKANYQRFTGNYFQYSSDNITSTNYYEAGFDTKVVKDFTLQVAGVKSSKTTDNKAYRVQLTYKGFNPFIAHTGDLFISYNKLPDNAVVNSLDDYTNGFKGVWIGGHLTVRNNMLITMWYQTGTNITTDAGGDHTAGTDHKVFRSQLDVFF
ncbi:MAG: S-layer protein [Firmicutes bacterium]|nr:S-layer protein [Bacillota bacterium]